MRSRTSIRAVFHAVVESFCIIKQTNFSSLGNCLGFVVGQEWAEAHVFEADAPADFDETKEGSKPPKFLATFPYPYMNGLLHLGHAFTLTKAEFAVRFHRLLGKHVLFPFGFHCTGMPIAACADKLKREIEAYGNPPKFPPPPPEPAAPEPGAAAAPAAGGATAAAASAPEHDDGEEDDEPEAAAAAGGATAAAGTAAAPAEKKKVRKGKSKVKAKTGKAVYQWEIMRDMKIPESEIPNFRVRKRSGVAKRRRLARAMRDTTRSGCCVVAFFFFLTIS